MKPHLEKETVMDCEERISSVLALKIDVMIERACSHDGTGSTAEPAIRVQPGYFTDMV